MAMTMKMLFFLPALFAVSNAADVLARPVAGAAPAPASAPASADSDAAPAPASYPQGPVPESVAKKMKTKKKGEAEDDAVPVTANRDDTVDVPYGDLQTFGREDTAQELTSSSVSESNEMIDQLERAEVAEEKRAVFRALTRLRGVTISSFDGVAKAQTSNIAAYAKKNSWRDAHPIKLLASEEADYTNWAFPNNADF
eukprot:TRINITY_DN109584_c0_g1_i1.p1 TRINITY_DN109584_c0_g1~~TRINITY_DN109584_c0_g1_i1.p1  ORF type:complete len:198 (+),score=64.32 TRINITY_DN109584_c0_g1_i1:105-698(+)